MPNHGPDGATPIDPDEADALIPDHVHSREQLNALEQSNILKAMEWIRVARKPALQEATVRELHRRMFDETWGWAGKYRLSDKTIGVYWAIVPEELRKMMDDGTYWLKENTFEIDETVLRLHHRLVHIHPFPNGNGRHARLWCDLLLRQNSRPPFEWKAEELNRPGDARDRYIRALQQADRGNYGPLFELYLPGRNRD